MMVVWRGPLLIKLEGKPAYSWKKALGLHSPEEDA